MLLFNENSAPLVHHYRVFSRGGAHASLHGRYMPKLRAFTIWVDAEAKSESNILRRGHLHCWRVQIISVAFANGSRMTTPHVARLAGRCLQVCRMCPLPTRLARLSPRQSLARTCTVGGNLYCLCCFPPQTLITRTSSHRRFNRFGRYSGVSGISGISHVDALS